MEVYDYNICVTQRMHWTWYFTLCEGILYRHLIRVNCRLYMARDLISKVRYVLIYPSVMGKNIICMIRQSLTMAPDHISQVSKVLIYLYFIGKNIVRTIRQALTIFSKTGMYGEQVIWLILLSKVWYWIYKSRMFRWKGIPAF